MANPGELMRRAAQRRMESRPRPVPEREASAAGERPDPVRPHAQPPRASHANYSALMRSHDRVHTCHLNGQG